MASTPTLKSSGSQTASVGTEHFLLSTSDNGVYVFIVNTTNMGGGDALELRIYAASTDGAATVGCYYVYFVNTQQTSDILKISVPIPAYSGSRFSLKQTAGTGRSYQWQVLAL